MGGGSIRIYDKKLQSNIFDLLGVNKEEANEKFGFLMNAFKYGAPPHGGMAFGFDRLIMLLAGSKQIRDVIAFPKTTSAMSLMDNSPSLVDENQLDELGLKNQKNFNEKNNKIKWFRICVLQVLMIKILKKCFKKFESNIDIEGDTLHRWLEKEIDKIELLINDIIFTINKKGYIDPTDMILIHSSFDVKNKKIDDDVILHTHSGAIIAQTQGQKEYYNAVLNNDIIFALSPAGTGKTYQAVACAVSALKNNEVEKIIITRLCC